MIEVNNQTRYRLKEKFLIAISQEILKKENREEQNLSIALVGPEKIRELNRKYRQKDNVTDVLSFSSQEVLTWVKNDNGLTPDLGEVIICPAKVKKNAKKFASTFEKELQRVLVHGILHLLGYEHETGQAQAIRMRKKEEACLDEMFPNS